MYRGSAGSLKAVHRALREVEKRAKYGNRKVVTEDGTFDSEKEYRRWRELQLMERAGEIHSLQRQVPYVLIPAQRDARGKVIEREVRYVADFVYREYPNTLVVEDTKGMKTKEYIIKRKLMLYRLGIRIREV